MTAAERLLKYVAVSTPSSEEGTGTPSTACQFDLAKLLGEEMREMGFADVRVTDNCFVYARIPATPGMENVPCMGLIAHMDTAPSFNGNNVNPQIIPDYDGSPVTLKASGAVLTPEQFPELTRMKGKTLITTDGSSLLGADDKAGVAEIMTACEAVLKSDRPHGPLAVAFTPDEEIGMGVLSFDVPGFGADYAYTVDGGDIGEISYENFNACEATVVFHGFSVHPGSSKDRMINACLLAMEFNGMLPSAETPRDTQNREGFFHLEGMQGDVVEAKFVYIVRDHDAARFAAREEQLKHITEIMNHRWGEGTVELKIREQYRNMREKIEPCMYIVENARKAMAKAGMEVFEAPVRGGTDGARLCYMGLPCPNLCTGGYAFHGPYEHIAAEDMALCTQMLIELIYGAAE